MKIQNVFFRHNKVLSIKDLPFLKLILLKRSSVLLPFIILLNSQLSFGQTPSTSGSTPTYNVNGEASLSTHYVKHGISQTDKDPALGGVFWFNLGSQFRLGLWGSNVHYNGTESHLNLKLLGEVKIIFSSNADLTLGYSQNQFYKTSSRNGTTVYIDVNLYSYHTLYEIESNWEGSETSSQYFAFQKTFNVFGEWAWMNQVGYSMIKATGYSSYFDFRSGLGVKIKQAFVEAVGTTTSASSQFNGAGDTFFLLNLKTQF